MADPLKSFENFFERIIFWSRWVQAPMYMGLAIGSFFYLYQFMHELYIMYEGMFIGRPDEVKRILLSNCNDLGRDRHHQGNGVPNLLKMLTET